MSIFSAIGNFLFGGHEADDDDGGFEMSFFEYCDKMDDDECRHSNDYLYDDDYSWKH